MTPASAAVADPVDFGRDILPILSDKCYQCHGPDPGTRKADLRLDVKEEALRAEAPVIVPGKSDESELIFRITSEDESEVMPPPDSNRKLSPAEIEMLRRWVDQGAEWGTHWAFDSPSRPAVPRPASGGRARNGIDRFILARLDREGLEPAPEATKETLIRRVTLDLTGLPPTPAEVDAFLADDGPDAYERVVDRLLASPRYGERMASEWLDLARFADTHGYQSDRERPMWPWRDWVIRALNRNQPFDEFVTWQLAGDLLPGASKEQRLATAFNRLHMQNEEGGIVEEEFRVSYVQDRVNTFGTAFLGLTLECARCHDHKFDPITQREYYALFSFFQNIDESGQTSYFTRAMPVPTLLLSDEAADARLAELERAIAEKAEALDRLEGQAGEDFDRWLEGRSASFDIPGLVGAFDFEAIAPDRVTNAADPAHPAKPHEGPASVAGRVGLGAELDGENGFTFPGVGHFTRVDPFSLALWLRSPGRPPRAVVIHHSRAPIDAGSRGYEMLLEDGRVAVGLHHMWPGNSLKVVTRDPLPVGEWAHVAVTYDGSSRAAGLRVYVDGSSVPLDVVRDGLVKDITYEGGEPDLAIGYRFRDSGFKGGRVDEFRVYDRRLTAPEVAHLAGRPDLRDAWSTPSARLSDAQRAALLEFYRGTADPRALQLASELHALRKEQSRLIDPIPEVMVMKELAKPKPAFVLRRGAYDAPGDPVSADTPASLPPFPGDQPRDRLGLARWLMAPDHPLTARVAVNRLWQMVFGTGIVETSDNFGRQGGQPTHPELLDWLAREFIDSGWDVKRMVRLLVTSGTYRQSSQASPERLAGDPSNVAAGAGAGSSADRRDAPRPGAGRQRAPGRAGRRAEREALPAGGALGSRDEFPPVRPGPRAGPLSPQPVHLLEADGPAPHDDDLRRGRAECLHRAPTEHEHAPAGPRPAERHAVRRGLEAAERADAQGRRRDRRRSLGLVVPPGDGTPCVGEGGGDPGPAVDRTACAVRRRPPGRGGIARRRRGEERPDARPRRAGGRGRAGPGDLEPRRGHAAALR